MTKFFTDFSSDTLGTLPADWQLTAGMNGEVVADGLQLSPTSTTSAVRYQTAWHRGLAVNGVTEIYCQYRLNRFSLYMMGIGASSGELTGIDLANISAMYRSSGTTGAANGISIDTGWMSRANATLSPAKSVSLTFNTLLQVTGSAVEGTSYTAKAWFWTSDQSPKTSASTPDLTYAGTFDHTHAAYGGISIDDYSPTVVTLTKYGIGTNGDPAPLSPLFVSDAIELNALLGVSPNLNLNELILVSDAIDLNASTGIAPVLTLGDSGNVSDAIDLNAAIGVSPNLILDELILVSDAIDLDVSVRAAPVLTLDDSGAVNDAIELNASLHVSPNLILNDLILVNDSIDLNAFISASSLLLLDDYSTELVSDSIELNASVRASPILSLSDSVLVDFAIDNALYLVEERLINAFIAGAPSFFGGRIKYPNAEFSTPNNLTWAQVFAPASFGPISTDASGCYEINQGQMVVTLFCPRGTGTRLIGAAAHEVKQLFGADNFEDVTITSVVVSPAPEPSSSPWYGINIVISFQYEGHRS